jgi:hypothetical protein
MYFRRDFSTVESGNYTFSIYANDIADVYIDGGFVVTADRDVTSTATVDATVSLASGCHTIFIKLTNVDVSANSSVLVASLKETGSSSPTVITDSTWRVSAGTAKSFAQIGYYADPSGWTSVRDYEAADTTNSSWTSTSGVASARSISTVHSYDGSNNYPSDSETYFRDSRVISLTSPVEVTASYVCDDTCNIILDGQIIGSGSSSAVNSTTLTLTEGSHKFGIVLYNSSGPSKVAFAVKRNSDDQMLTRTDKGWLARSFWTTLATSQDPYSYDYNFLPSPPINKVAPYKAIANIITNPSLESNTTDWVGNGATIARSTSWSSEGSASLAINSTSGQSYSYILGNNGTLYPGIEIGKTYTISATVHIGSALSSLNTAYPNRELSITAFWYVNGAYDWSQVQAPNVAGTYQLKMTYTVPSGSTYAFFRLTHGGESGTSTVYWDSVMLAKVSRSMSADDGYNYRAGNSSGWSWDGAANNSTSTGPEP